MLNLPFALAVALRVGDGLGDGWRSFASAFWQRRLVRMIHP
jgi:hypothetical protein